MSPRATIAALAGTAVAAALAGCLVDERPFAPVACGPGRSCGAFYTCVDSEVDGPICVAAYSPARDASVSPPGPFRDYCHDAWPLFDAYCVECHGPDQQLGVTRFRLDLYDTDAGFYGAKAMAPVIRQQVFTFRIMPPQNAHAFPALGERLIIAQWVDAGAPYCAADGGDGGG